MASLRGLPGFALCVGGLLVTVSCGSPPPESFELHDYGPTAAFDLTDESGSPFSSENLRGEVVLMFFGYTSCPDFCPTTMSKITRVESLISEISGKQSPRGLRTVFITVDPEHDTPTRLREYLEFFAFETVGLTGSAEQIEAVLAAYGAFAEQSSEEAEPRIFAHTTYLFLIDQRGTLRALFDPTESAERIARTTARLLMHE